MSIAKKILYVLFLALLSLLAVLVVNTCQFTVKLGPDSVADVEITLDGAAVVKRLATALTFPTVSHQNIEEQNRQAFHDLDAHLEASFPLVFSTLEVEVVSELSYLIKWQGADDSLRPMGLLGHKDVVPVAPGSEEHWDQPPFSGNVEEGYIWGRGAIDNKSGVLGLLEAAEYLLHQEFQPARTIYFAFGHDEEIGGRDGAAKIAELLAQRNIELEFLLDEGGYLITGMFGVDEPVAVIGTGEKGFLTLTLTAQGAGGHSSQPPEFTVAGRVARAVDRLQSNQFPARFDRIAEFTRGMGDTQSFTQRMIFANTWFFERFAKHIVPAEPLLWAGMRTTIAPTMFQSGFKSNVLPLTAQAVINFRIYPGETSETVTARAIEVINDEQIRVEPIGTISEPSRTSDTDSFGFRQMSRSIREVVLDKKLLVVPNLVIGATDARHYGKVSNDSYRFVGLGVSREEFSGFHGTNERVAVSSYLDAIRIYIQFIKNSTVAPPAND